MSGSRISAIRPFLDTEEIQIEKYDTQKYVLFHFIPMIIMGTYIKLHIIIRR